MFKKGSKAYSIFALKCPRCHEGEMFETGSWSFVKSFDMLHRCPKCNLNYYPEPGYYYGAMFISYLDRLVLPAFRGLISLDFRLEPNHGV